MKPFPRTRSASWCARAAIVDARMPDRRQKRTWGGPSAGLACPACGEKIAKGDVEVEMEFDGQAHDHYHVHFRCFTAREAELKTRDGPS